MASTAWHRANTTPCLGCGKPVQARKRETSTGRCKRCWDRPKTLVPCPRCSKEFWPWANGKHARKFCCDHPPKPEAQPVQRTCAWCHGAFLQPPKTPRRNYCTPEHAKRGHSHASHIRRRITRAPAYRSGENVDLEVVYRRDRGVCGICHGNVPANFRFAATRADTPTIDHIVPISAGGTHTYANVQLAHHGCNSRKGNKSGCHSQLRLV